jgi:hypothetical protein
MELGSFSRTKLVFILYNGHLTLNSETTLRIRIFVVVESGKFRTLPNDDRSSPTGQRYLAGAD